MVEKVSDFMMPEKIVTRLLKDALPENVLITAERAQMNNRRTLENQDIIRAVTELGLGEHAPQLVRFGAQRKRNAKRKESNIQQRSRSNKKISADQQHPEESIQSYQGGGYNNLEESHNNPEMSVADIEQENESQEGELDEEEEGGPSQESIQIIEFDR